ncbi:spore coat protein JA [Aneurinibacillus soli]|uniref:Spore coat associated protein JA (CotJA) n=1 Tax=Aneurinibacillus soli TaxID=1500254 RepID=A0A0U5B039_9BACL|nr:spore coat associated protein CotJA [Aneurinibacillus soli]PYE59654.1 spore coat protein JA [Aneurinibacillus soli]BAU29345.1 Spore coat associated protein JA (CotJA) [Aneurinibacillus soli]
MHTFRKTYTVYTSPHNPCPPMKVRTYETPPQLYMTFQPPGLPQFPPAEAFRHGTLWPSLFAPYESPYKSGKREEAD